MAHVDRYLAVTRSHAPRAAAWHLLLAQTVFLRKQLLLIATLLVLAVPLLLWLLVDADVLQAGRLIGGFRQHAERFLPLWVVVASALIWRDAEPRHHSLFKAWPVVPWQLLGAKSATVLLGYGLLAAITAAGGPLILEAALPEAPDDAVPRDLLFTRAMASGFYFAGIMAVAGAAGRLPAGIFATAGVWMANFLAVGHDPAAWEAAVGGAAYLFAWSAESQQPLASLTTGTLLAGLLFHAVALAVLHRWRA